jgi:hypothetical protein
MWKEVVVVYFGIVLGNLPIETEKSDENPQDDPVFRLIFESVTYLKQTLPFGPTLGVTG